MKENVYLVTGAMGCIGSWVLRNLLDDGQKVVSADLGTQATRARLLLEEDQINQINWQQLDITDGAALNHLVKESGISHIIHLAGLQIPFCKADPPRGAAVNVLGTVNVLEAARQHEVKHVCYASSIAAFGPDSYYPEKPVADNARLFPLSLYGVYTQANEATALVYWEDWQVGSIGLRPAVVYGVGRDQGLTSDLAKAILAAAAGESFRIRFNGPIALQYADDVARLFIASANAGLEGAAACNLRGDVIEVSDFVDVLKQVCPSADISVANEPSLPFPSDFDDSGLTKLLGTLPHTPLARAIEDSLNRFERLLSKGQIDLSQLEE